jgi:hypothetical protein
VRERGRDCSSLVRAVRERGRACSSPVGPVRETPAESKREGERVNRETKRARDPDLPGLTAVPQPVVGVLLRE